MTIGKRIKQVRNEKGLTQKQLGELSKTSEGTVRQYEIGKRQPRLEQLRRIAAALGVDWTDLVDSDTAAKMTIDHMTGKLKALSTPVERVTCDMSQMTQEGQEKVADYAADILPRYRAEPAPDAGEGNEPPRTPEEE